MNKADLVAKVAEKSGVTKKDAEKALTTCLLPALRMRAI